MRAGSDVRLLVVEGDNRAGSRRLWGAEARSVSLMGRRLFRRSKGVGPKLAEFTVRALVEILRRRPDVVWSHNQEAALIVADALLLRRLGRVNRVVWDQHELPGALVLEGRWAGRVWARLMASCDAVVVANHERREFLEEHLAGGRAVRYVVLENRADRIFRDLPAGDLPEDLRTWLDGRLYLLLQGGAHPHRHFEQAVEAALARPDPDVALVIVGGGGGARQASLRQRWGEDFDRRVFFTGWVPQLEMAPLIDHAAASVVLYDAGRPNTRYCAPNRLHQAIARGTPVIVGSNPPMAALVGEHGVGLVLDGTGESSEDIARAIRTLLADPAPYRAAAERARDLLLWESQDAEIRWVRDGGSADPAGLSDPARHTQTALS